MSPTARTLAKLRQAGYLAEVVERRIPGCSRTADLFGIGDVLAVHAEERDVLLVQVTVVSHLADRVARVVKAPATPVLLKSGIRIEVWAWSPPPKGGRRRTWEVVKRPVGLGSIPVAEV